MLAERLTGAVAEVWDTPGRRGAVDIRLTYPDGRTAGLEVIRATTARLGEVEGRLQREGYTWPAPPGTRWWWSATISEPADINELRERIPRILPVCEAAGASNPTMMWRIAADDEDLTWLTESSVQLFGHPNMPSRGTIMVTPPGGGGAVDDDFGGIDDFLRDLFEAEEKHVQKTVNDAADEHHLCFLVDDSRALFSIADAICRSPNVPPDAPPMPEGLTHLWLIGRQYGVRVLTWSAGSGWISTRFSDLPVLT